VKRRADQLGDMHPFLPSVEQSSARLSRHDHLVALEHAGYRITRRPTEDGNRLPCYTTVMRHIRKC